jgi:rubrerythrin
MKAFNDIDDVLDFAIGEEVAAQQFYLKLAETATDQAMKEVFEGFAREEQGHKAKLEAVKAGKLRHAFTGRPQDLKIAEITVQVDPTTETGYQEALILAMKKEKAAYRMYSDLADMTEEPELRDLFLGLAQEEARHKLRFEIEYDDNVLTDN